MNFKFLRKSQPMMQIIGLGIDVAGLAIGASKFLQTHTIF